MCLYCNKRVFGAAGERRGEDKKKEEEESSPLQSFFLFAGDLQQSGEKKKERGELSFFFSRMPAVCGTLLRDGTACRRRIGHVGECERFCGKRRDRLQVKKVSREAKWLCYERRSSRIGPEYQAIIPELVL